MKDKIKVSKPVDENSTTVNKKDTDLIQCPYCKKLEHVGNAHECNENYFVCTICGVDLHKKSKEVKSFGHKYHTMPSKKFYSIINSIICWGCAFKIVKAFKSEDKNAK